jgi:hypothetical protein
MGVDYEPISRQARQARFKKTAPVLVLGTLTTLVSPAISGIIRHVVDVTVQPLSGNTGIILAAVDASGASSNIARANWGDKAQFYTPGNRENKMWTPPFGSTEEDDELYQLHAGESLKAMGEDNSSGASFAVTTFWDEGGVQR